MKTTAVKKGISSSKKPALLQPILITPILAQNGLKTSSPKAKPNEKDDNHAGEVLGSREKYVQDTVEEEHDNDLGGLLKAMLPKPRKSPGQAENNAGEVDAPLGTGNEKKDAENGLKDIHDNDLGFVDNKQGGNDDFDIVDRGDLKKPELQVKAINSLDDGEMSKH